MNVAPRAGAWIEISDGVKKIFTVEVAPRAGAWIEIRAKEVEDGLSGVAPRAGAWIEILGWRLDPQQVPCRTPCGCVD